MAFQATKWDWKGLAARLLLVPVLAGASAGVAGAGDPAPPAKAAAGKTSPALPAAPAAPADPKELLKLAKKALAAGQLDKAQDYATKANQTAAAKGLKWGLFDDTPASVMRDVQEARAKADKARSEQLFKDARAAYDRPAKTDADRIRNLDQALNLAYQAKNLHGPYSVWDFGDKPDKLISDAESAKAKLRKKMPPAADVAARTPAATKAGPAVKQAAATARTGDRGGVTTAALTTPKAPAAAANPAKAAVAKLVADGRAALAQERVLEARAKANEARTLAGEKGLTASFGPAEDSPDALYQACQSKGREMIASLTRDAERQTKAREFAKADAALEYAQKLSDGLGLYSKPIAEQRAMLAKQSGKPPAAAPAAPVAPAGTAVASGPMMPAAPKTLPALAPVMPAASAVAALPAPPAPPKAPDMPAAPAAPGVAMVVPKPSTPAPAPVPTSVAVAVALPAAPVPAAVPVAQTPAPTAVAVAPVPAPAAPVNLLDQAAAEMKRGDLDMARKIAIQVHNTSDPAGKVQAQSLLRQIDVEYLAVRQRTARTALENGMTEYAGRRYESALGVFKQIDPALLPEEQKKRLADSMTDCLAKTAPAGDAVRLTANESPTAPPGVARLGGAAQGPAGEGGLADQQKAIGEVAYQKLRQEGFEALNAATTAWGRGETDAAIQTLTDYTARVKASNQSPSRQAMLLRPVDERVERFRLLKHHTDFLTKEAKDKVDVRRELVAATVAETQKQDEVKRKIRQINELTKAGKFKEAEMAAAQLKQLDPDDPAVTFAAEQTKMRRRMEEYKQIRNDHEELFRVGLNDAEKEGKPLTVDNPLSVNPEMARRAALRGDGDAYLRARTPAEMIIEQRLSAPFSFKYENQSLRSVIDEIRLKAHLNITTDSAALDDEKLSLDDVKVTEEVHELALRDGLAILLGKARLAFVVENNVVKVTTEKRSRGRMTAKVFHVMDLVTPIPEFAPAPYERLDTAMASAKGTMPGALAAMAGSGGSTPFIPNSGLQGGQMVSGGQQGVPGAAPGGPFAGGGSLQNNLQFQPGAMAPQRVQYAEQLKKLITGMVRPYSWAAMGGPGNLEYYDVGGALVVNQTADVIREVQELLESLRRLQDLSVAVEIRVISLSEAFFERVGVDFAVNVPTAQGAKGAQFQAQLATSQFAPEPYLNNYSTPRGLTVGYNPAVGGFTPDLSVPIKSTSYGLSLPPFGGYQDALSPTNNGGIGVGLAFLNDIQVYMFLEAAQGNRRINVMQAPKLTLFNGQTATVFVGDVAYFTTGLQVFNVGGQFVYLPQNVAFPIGNGINPNGGGQGGVSVTVQAVISADRRFVRMNLSPTLTALASATVPLFPVSTFITPVFEGGSQGQPVPFTQFFQQPSFSQISVQTTVACPDGGTVLLGGLKTLAQGRNEFGPPVISQIPYLNRLFKNVGVGQETRHVMLMVTPRIIINSEEEARQVGEGGGLVVPQP